MSGCGQGCCRHGLVNGHDGCPTCMARLRAQRPGRTDQQIEAELIDQYDDALARVESGAR